MNRHVCVVGVLATVVAGGVASCGSEDKPESAPVVTAATSSAPAPTTAVPAPQPSGAAGVTYEIQNWDEYAHEPVVLAWKVTMEAIAASVNERTILPAARAGLSKEGRQIFEPSLEEARKQDLIVKPVGQVKVQSAETSGSRASLVVCQWASSVSYYDKDGKAAGGTEDAWAKQRVGMRMRAGAWVIDSVEFGGKCSGAAPS